MKSLLLLYDFNQIVVKMPNIKFMKIHFAGAEFHRKYGRTDVRDEANSRCSQLCYLACKCRTFLQHVMEHFSVLHFYEVGISFRFQILL